MKPSDEQLYKLAQDFGGNVRREVRTNYSPVIAVTFSPGDFQRFAQALYTAGRESMREEAAKVCEALADNYLHLSTTTDAIRVELAYLYKQAAAMHCHNEIRDLPISEE